MVIKIKMSLSRQLAINVDKCDSALDLTTFPPSRESDIRGKRRIVLHDFS